MLPININNYQLHPIIQETYISSVKSFILNIASLGRDRYTIITLKDITICLLYFLNNKLKMADLDLSGHMLNTSTSKQKFSFPKTQRFSSRNNVLYGWLYSAVIVSMKCHPLAIVGQPLSDMGRKILDSR